MVKGFVALLFLTLGLNVGSEPHGQILFSALRYQPDAVSQIYLADVETSDLRLLVDDVRGTGGVASWSPDGMHIVYSDALAGNYDVFTLDVPLDSNAVIPEPARLTETPADETRPVWSPDGQRIAFIVSENEQRRIYTAAADGSDRRLVSDLPASEYSTLDWMQHGAKLLFQTTNTDGYHPFAITSADGSGSPVILTAPEMDENYTVCGHAWSDAAGRLVANLAAERDCVSGGAAYLLAETSGVFESLPMDSNPALMSYAYDWSPDGTVLGFVRTADSFGVTQQLHTLDIASGVYQTLTGADDLTPDGTAGYLKNAVDWSPDQQWLAFAWIFGESLKRQAAVYVIAPDGSDLRLVTPVLEGDVSISGVAWRFR